MPPRSKVSQLPVELRAELEQRLVASAFSGYEALEDWLEAQGYAIGKSSLQREGTKLQRRIEAIKASTEAARAIAAAAPDDEGHLTGAVINLVQSDIFEALVAMQEAEGAEPAERLELLGKAARAVADAGRASISQKKWALQARASLADEVTTKLSAGPRKLDAEALELVRRAIRGDA